MSNLPAVSMPRPGLPAQLRASAQKKVVAHGLTLTGVLLFVIGLLVTASGFLWMRPEVAGLAVHPYLLPMALCFPFVAMSRIVEFPMLILAAMSTFVAIYCFSVFNGGSVPPNEILKVGSALVTIVTCALLVRRRGDFLAGALGLNLAIALLAWKGLQDVGAAGVEAMDGANKNSYSMFALPAMLITGYIVTRMSDAPALVRNTLLACTVPALLAIFMSGNRSGYLGAVLVALMLFWDRRGKGLMIVGAMALIVGVLLTQFGSTEVLSQRLEQTAEGTHSDELRKQLIIGCFEIGLENPVIGVSPQALGHQLARRVGGVYSARDSHNVFGHIWAGSGLICFAALGGIAYTMWTWKPKGGPIKDKSDPFWISHRLLRMMVILWIVRGFFSREVLYNPSFCIAFGLVIGWCLLAEKVRQQEPDAGRKAAAQPALAMPGG